MNRLFVARVLIAATYRRSCREVWQQHGGTAVGGSCGSRKAVPCRSAGGPVVQGRAGRKLKETNSYALVCDVQHDVSAALNRPRQALIFARKSAARARVLR
jgi:hypothetical protein